MNISQEVQKIIDAKEAGVIFGYQDISFYNEAHKAVIKTMSRMVSANKVKKLSKGKFYVPRKGLLGFRKPSDDELIRDFLYKNGRLRGYVTGLHLFNQLGLTTQMPGTITLAYKGGRLSKDFGTIKIRTLITHAPITEDNVKLLKYLDVLKDIKKIPDADVNQSLTIMKQYISKLSPLHQKELMTLALDYYSPQTRALVGLIYTDLGISFAPNLLKSLNPTTTYKLCLDKDSWPDAIDWYIR